MCPTIIQREMQVLKISWIALLATGIGILGFGIIVTAYPQIAGPNEEGLLRAIGVATTGMGIFGVMITLKAYRRKEKWAWFTLWYYPIFWTIHLAGDCRREMIISIKLFSLLYRYWVCYFLLGSSF
jgi:hypothetical protein